MRSFLLQIRLLAELVDYHLQHGIRSDNYLDEETGGIYEHKLANRMGIEVNNASLPVEFLDAAADLERKGLVRRNRRRPDFPVQGIRPTEEGIRAGKRWITILRISRKFSSAQIRVAGRQIAVWFVTSVLLAGSLFALVVFLVTNILSILTVLIRWPS